MNNYTKDWKSIKSNKFIGVLAHLYASFKPFEIVFFLLSLSRIKVSRRNIPELLVLAYVYFNLYVTSMLNHTSDIPYRFKIILGFTFLIIFFIVLKRETGFFLTFMKSFIFGAAIISFLGILDRLFQTFDRFFIYKETQRLTATYQDPNFYAFALCVAIFSLNEIKLFKSTTAFLIKLILYSAVFLSLSRAGILTAIILLSFETIKKFNKINFQSILVVTGLSTTAFAATYSALPNIALKITERFSTDLLSGRDQHWKTYINNLNLNELLFGEFSYYDTNYLQFTSISETLGLVASHNIFLQIMLNCGLLGLGLIVLLIIKNSGKQSVNLMLFGAFLMTLDLLFTRSFWLLLVVLNFIDRQEKEAAL